MIPLNYLKHCPKCGKPWAEISPVGWYFCEVDRWFKPEDFERIAREASNTETPGSSTRARDGEAWLYGSDVELVPIVGDGDDCIMAARESLMLVGPDGVGKTSIAQQFTLARAGLRSDWLGFNVQPTSSKILLGAHDRPKQALRSMKRMITDADRDLLRERVIAWEGPLPFDVGTSPEALPDFLQALGVDTYVIDGLKDIAVDLSTDAVGSRVNHALQLCLQAGIQILALHWPRKAQGDNRKPNKIADIYGSRLITAGFGSIVLLWGEAGDSIVEWSHIKQPANEVGPFKLLHDHEHGVTTIMDKVDAFSLVTSHNGLSAAFVASQLYNVDKPTENQVKKAQRQLDALVRRGAAHKVEGSRGGGPDSHKPALWYAVEQSRKQSRGGFSENQSRTAEAMPNGAHPDSESNPVSNDGNPATSNPVSASLFKRGRTDAAAPNRCPVCDEPMPSMMICHPHCVPEFERQKRDLAAAGQTR